MGHRQADLAGYTRRQAELYYEHGERRIARRRAEFIGDAATAHWAKPGDRDKRIRALEGI